MERSKKNYPRAPWAVWDHVSPHEREQPRAFSRFSQRIKTPSRQRGWWDVFHLLSCSGRSWNRKCCFCSVLMVVQSCFGKTSPSGQQRQATWKCDIVETKATGEWHHERGYLNISVTKNGLNCFPKWALAEQRESLWFQGFLKYFWNETLWMFCGCWSLECSVVLELRVHTIKALSTLLKASSNTLKEAQEAVFMFSGWL